RPAPQGHGHRHRRRPHRRCRAARRRGRRPAGGEPAGAGRRRPGPLRPAARGRAAVRHGGLTPRPPGLRAVPVPTPVSSRQGTGTARIPTPTPRPFHRNGTRARVRPLTGGRDRTRGPRGLRGAPTRGIGRSPAGGTGTRGGVRASAVVKAAGATPST